MADVRLVPQRVRERYLKVDFLSDEQQARYECLTSHYRGKAANSLNLGLNESNIFKLLFLESRGQGLCLFRDIDHARMNGLDIEGMSFATPEVVLRSYGDIDKNNEYVAQRLADAIGKKSFKHPVVISGLELVEDEESAYGFRFETGNKTKVIDAEILGHKYDGARFMTVGEKNLPILDDKGKRQIFTRPEGISVVRYIYRNGHFGTSRECLSSGNGFRTLVTEK